MKITKTFYTSDRKKWRAWLEKNHGKEKEMWLVYYKKSSGKPRISYDDAVEEALCFGWIDSTVKTIDEEKFAQRFTPRRTAKNWSELNKERVRKLVKQGKMTPAGMAKIECTITHDASHPTERVKIKQDILKALKKDKKAWHYFQHFPDAYKRIRISWIESARTRPELFKQRLNYFMKMTSQNKKYGTIQ